MTSAFVTSRAGSRQSGRGPGATIPPDSPDVETRCVMAMMVWHALRNVDLHDVPARARALEALGYDFITTPRVQARSVPAADAGGGAHGAAALQHLRGDRLPARALHHGEPRVGPRALLGRALRAGARHAGERAQRAPLLRPLGAARPAAARLYSLHPRDLALLADRRQAGLRGRVLPLHPDQPGLRPRPDRAPRYRHRDLGGESLQHAPRRRALRRDRRPPREQLPPSAGGRAASRLRGRAPRRA